MLTRVAQAAPRATGLAHLLRAGLNAVGATNTKISGPPSPPKKKQINKIINVNERIYFVYLLKSRLLALTVMLIFVFRGTLKKILP